MSASIMSAPVKAVCLTALSPLSLAPAHEHLQGMAANGQERMTVCLQAGSLDFLASQGFDFNKFIYEGVPLLRASDRDRHLSKMNAGADEAAPARPDIPLDKPENRELVDRLIAQVAEWLKVCGILCRQHPHSSASG